MLDTLKSVSEIDAVVINTDAREILAENGLIESERVIIRDRKSEICGDFVSMNIIINDDIQNIDADICLMTHTTNPLLSKKSVEAAISQFKDALNHGTANSLFTVNKNLITKYFTNLKDNVEKSNKFVEYLNNFYEFCFDKSPNSVLEEVKNYKF